MMILLGRISWSFPGGSDMKESACNAEDPGLTPGSEDPLEKGMATHFSIPARRVPRSKQSGRQVFFPCGTFLSLLLLESLLHVSWHSLCYPIDLICCFQFFFWFCLHLFFCLLFKYLADHLFILLCHLSANHCF